MSSSIAAERKRGIKGGRGDEEKGLKKKERGREEEDRVPSKAEMNLWPPL